MDIKQLGRQTPVGHIRVGDRFYSLSLFMEHKDEVLVFCDFNREPIIEISRDSYVTTLKPNGKKVQVGKLAIRETAPNRYVWDFILFATNTTEQELFETTNTDIFKTEELVVQLLVQRGLV